MERLGQGILLKEMLQKEELKRYNRQIILPEIGLDGQLKLKSARVAVVGAGGLGCPVLQYLTAAGIGNIGIIDDDKVHESNLHRQILYNTNDTGKNKAAVAAAKLKTLNPCVNIISFETRLTGSNAVQILSDYDLIIDGSDNFATRYLVNDICLSLGKPFVSGAIFGFEGQLSVFNYMDGPTYRCLFPEASESPSCAENGVLGVLPGILGSYMANEAIKIICGIGEILSGKLMVINILNNSVNFFRITRSVVNPHTPSLQEEMINGSGIKDSGEFVPEEPFDEWTEHLPEGMLLVDVRGPLESEADPIGGINIPLEDITDEYQSLPADKKVFFYCNSGNRSKKAMEIFKQLKPGAEAFWMKAQ